MPSQVAIDARLFPYDPQHETFVNAYVADSLRDQDLIDAKHPRIAFATGAAPRLMAVVRRFVGAGIHHIFIGPDHILFVIGLLLLGGSTGRLLKIVTGFTVAHSITLALATLGLVTPPARLIEPLIALSIVFVGIDNLLALLRPPPVPAAPGVRAVDHRAWLAFGFGFVHGFGFASVLREFGLPAQALGVALFAFNLGVECGQATIVLAVAPALALLHRASGFAWRRVAIAGSFVVVLAGAFWFVQRVVVQL
jgi:hydrogenase/urease accessory protein HupE